MRRERIQAIKDLTQISDALRIAGPDRFKKEIQDLEYEVEKLKKTSVQFVYMDLILSHVIMSASLRERPCQA